jgi:hypothetical protein
MEPISGRSGRSLYYRVRRGGVGATDGRFLMLKRAGAESQTIVVHNWGPELREKTAVRK